MALKNSYEISDQESNFDLEQLHNGEVAVVIESFRERKAKEVPVIVLGCRIAWTANEADHQYIDQTFSHDLFWGPNNAMTRKILKDTLRRAGFTVDKWTPGSATPQSLMLPSALKLLAWKRAMVVGKITRSKNNEGVERAFFNFSKILRVDPHNGEALEDALPNPVPDSLVLEAFHVEGLEGDDFPHGANEIPV